MKHFNNKLLLTAIQSDLIIIDNSLSIPLIFSSYTYILKNLKQLTRVLQNVLPIVFVCNDKQQIMLIRRFLINRLQFSKILIVSLKDAVNIKVPAIFIFFSVLDTDLITTKIKNNSNSIIFIINNKAAINNIAFDFYSLRVALRKLNQILFIIAVINKTLKFKKNYEGCK